MSETSSHSLAEHLITCRKIDGALVAEGGIDMTPAVESMIADGWELEREEVVGGKRVRYLRKTRKEGQDG